ncbi:MAG: ArnT family glycosyltransferase [bacterium]
MLIRKKIPQEFKIKRSNCFFILIPLISFLTALLISYFFFQGIPHIQDSINYKIMAENFASGRLHNKMPEHYEFFKFLYMIPDGENYYSMFLPGYSFFLVPFILLKIPIIANPLLTALNIYLTGAVAKKLFDERTAVIAMIFALFSNFLLIMGGTFMAHPFCATLTLLALYSHLLSLEKSSWKHSIITGISIGWLLIIRPQNAIFLAIPLALYTLFQIRNKAVIKNSAVAFISFLPFLAFLLFYNWIYTGNPLIFKQDIYFNYSEPGAMCHRFGIGSGCPNSNWIDMPTEGLTWTHAFIVSYRRLASLIMNLFLHPLSFIFFYVAFLMSKNKKELATLSFLFSIFLFTFFGYFFFYFDGNVFGPRYYYETAFLLVIILANGFVKAQKKSSVLTFSFLTAAFIFQSAVIIPELYNNYKHGFWEVDQKLESAVKENRIENAVVFVSPKRLFGSGFVTMDLSDLNKNSVIYAIDLGEKQNSRLMNDYPDRKYYLAKFKQCSRNTEQPDIIEISSEKEFEKLHIELEDKSYPLTGIPDYCNVFPEREYLYKYLNIAPPTEHLREGELLFFCRFTKEEQYYDFGQKFEAAGKYKMIVKAIGGPDMGRFKVFVNDKFEALLDFNSPNNEFNYFSVDIDIKRGFSKIKLQPDKLVSSLNYFFIDYIEFLPRREY